MRHLPTLIGGLLLCGVIALPNSSAQQAQEEVALTKLQSDFFSLEERISQLSGVQEELQHTLGSLQEQINSLAEKLQSSSDDDDSNAVTQDLLQRLEQLEELTLDKRLKQLELENEINSEKQVQSQEKSEPVKDDATETAEAEAPPASDVDIKAAFQEAFKKLTERQYEQAEVAFKDFIENYGTHSLAGNAVYWLGESYYVRSDYRSAAQQFLTSYNDYPKGNKRFDSLLKLILSMKALKQTDQACLALGELLTASETEGVVSDSIRSRAEKEKETLECP